MPENTSSPAKPLTKLDAVRRIKPDDLRSAVEQGTVKLNNPLTEEEMRIANALQRNEADDWRRFMSGKEIPVPLPPINLVRVVENLRKAGIHSFEPRYLPGLEVSNTDDSIKWSIRPSDFIWDIQEFVSSGLIGYGTLLKGWVLFDKTHQLQLNPPLGNGPASYIYTTDDPIKTVIEDLREKGRLSSGPGILSRFGISGTELADIVLPEVARFIGVNPDQVTLPSYLEHTMLANMHYPGLLTLWKNEFFRDTEPDGQVLIGGKLENVGKSTIVTPVLRETKSEEIGFRPMIAFPDKT